MIDFWGDIGGVRNPRSGSASSTKKIYQTRRLNAGTLWRIWPRVAEWNKLLILPSEWSSLRCPFCHFEARDCFGLFADQFLKCLEGTVAKIALLFERIGHTRQG